jgi:preprotein translocase subunit SecD
MRRPVWFRLLLLLSFSAISIFLLMKKSLILGLDLQGGMHLVLEVDGAKAVENDVERTYTALKASLAAENISTSTSIRKEGNIISLSVPKESEEAVTKILNLPNWKIKKEGETRTLSLKEEEVKQIKENATSQALETIRNRIDQFGVAEPLIQRQGDDQILLQLPGIKDPRRAVELVGRTALLEFKLVDDDHPMTKLFPASIEADQEEKVLGEYKEQMPADKEILFERVVDKETKEVTKRPYLVYKQAAVTGNVLSDARVIIGDFNEPQTSITFDPVGAKMFEAVTGANLQKRLAIILDNTVYSAPVIQDKISGGRAQITGSFTTQEANDLAIALRAGALPAPVNIIQNVTVGPSLGQDSIEKGIKTAVVGTLLVMFYMIFYYRLSGLLADFTLILNLLLLLGALSALGATLTLPGIAAIVLTIGMAVDSNVLIYERIRDEQKKGRPVRLAVNAGYDKAFSSIFDSHVTTLITAVALFLFGTGPIKGFAVSLSLGVVINLFTALVGTRVVFDFINQRWRLERLSV